MSRVAVVGCGQWGRNLVRNFSEMGVLACVSDPSPESQSLAGAFGVENRPLEQVFADASIPAVAIATPAATHYELACAALAAGKHVFVEKPLALSSVEGEDMIRRSHAANRVLMVGHLLQYHPAFHALRKLAATRDLGEVRNVQSRRLSFGRVRQEEDVLQSFAPHDLSMVLALMGEEPTEVWAAGSSLLQPGIVDMATVEMSFSGGRSAQIMVSWLNPVKEQRLVVVGSRGMAVLDDMEPWPSKLMLYRHSVAWENHAPHLVKGTAEPVPLQPMESLRAECAHFLACCDTGGRPRTDGGEALAVLRVLERARASLNVSASARGAATAPPPPRPGVGGIHGSAYIDEGVEVGRGSRVWHFTHLLSGTKIGRDCVIGQNVMIGPDVRIGDRCKIQNNVSVYKGVTLEDGVFLGPSCVFTNVRVPRAEVNRMTEFEPTLIRRGASVGANATLVCGITLGEYCLVAAGAVVTHDVPAHALVAGVPARPVGWVSRTGDRLGDDLVCPRTGERYALEGNTLVRLP